MSRYLISDHHFNHSRIIEYIDRPFSSIGDMNETLLNRHYKTVDEDDTLLHLGDVAMDMRSGEDTVEFFERPRGDLLIRGNHDVGLDPDDAPFPVVESCIVEHGGRQYYCTHRPEDIPDDWNGWAIHGHTHNNETDTFPFVASGARRVNVSCELLNYRPLTLETISRILDRCRAGASYRNIGAVRAELS